MIALVALMKIYFNLLLLVRQENFILFHLHILTQKVFSSFLLFDYGIRTSGKRCASSNLIICEVVDARLGFLFSPGRRENPERPPQGC